MIKPIKLFEFQNDAKNFLLDKTTNKSSKHKIILKSPTGSGKTIILQSYIEEYFEYVDQEMIFLWLTPGKGDLEEQSKSKMKKILPNLKTGDIHDILLQGFLKGTTYFINWEMITNKNNNALNDDTEQKNLFERIIDGHRKNYEFIVIIDEEHLNNTIKANNVLNALKSKYEIRVSATTKSNPTAEFYEITEEEVINSGLITKALYINEDIHIDEMNDELDEASLLIKTANKKRLEIKNAYNEKNENINPLVIIQVPNESDRLILYVENLLNNMGYSYENKLLSKWLSNEKVNITNLTLNDNSANFLIMKQAISTGWDCPRAKILVKLRPKGDENFEIQTLGRIRRMPKSRHYEDDRLDFCFLYTFDEKYKNKVIQSGNAYEVRRLFLKEKYKNFKMIKEVRNKDFEYVNELEARNKIYDYFFKKYNLNNKQKENKIKLENYGYIFGTKLLNTYRSGLFRTEKELLDETIGTRNEYTIEVNIHKNGLDCLRSIDNIKKVIGLPTSKTRAILLHLFHHKIPSSKKLINLNNKEWYAFMINNMDRLINDFFEVTVIPKEVQEQALFKKEVEFKLPLEDFYKYLPYELDIDIYHNNAYHDYDTSMTTSELRSNSEQLFEIFLENKSDIEWYYKNGDSGKQYLSIVYETNISKQYLFYPDYIIQKKNGDVWIIETKGGEYKGKSKNIDKQIWNKFIAFKNYAKVHNINWGFVRDRNQKLFINNTIYTEEMNNENWINIEEIF